MKGLWWKLLAVFLVLYTVIGGMLFPVPRLYILNETIRNLYFHVPMWWTMMLLFIISFVYSIRHLSTNKLEFNEIASDAVKTGMVFGIAGIITGMLWAKYTWGDFWTNDVQLNGAAITLLAYSAYLVLRNMLEDEQKKARFTAVYNIFALIFMIVFIGVLPRLTESDSLHPGKGGNPGFNAYDLNNNMRLVFYPAVLGWMLTGIWIMQVKSRISRVLKPVTE